MREESSGPTTLQQDPSRQAERPFLGGRSFDLLMGLGVLMISMISLFVAVSANRTQERMLAASVWPSLLFGTSSVSLDGEPQITFDLLNRGVGPVRLRACYCSVLDDCWLLDSESRSDEPMPVKQRPAPPGVTWGSPREDAAKSG